MISATSISSAGLVAASQRFASSATQVAEIGTSLPSATQVDLSSTAVQMIEDKAAFTANAAVLRASDAMERKVLDIRV